VSKRAKTDGALIPIQQQQQASNKQLIPLPPGVKRTSSLLSPTMLLSGHQGEVWATKFSPSGKELASASFDKTILLWKTTGECPNYGLLSGHTSSVLDVVWNADGTALWSCSADRTVILWDVVQGQRQRKLQNHKSIVNSVAVAKDKHLAASASDEGISYIWDARSKQPAFTIREKHPMLSVALSASGQADRLFVSGIDPDIHMYDLRHPQQSSMTLSGHVDSVTGISLSPDGSHLLSNSMDQTLRMWDIRPYAGGDRCVKFFMGHVHNFEKNLLRCSWSPDSSKVAAGSADRFVYVWDAASGRVLYKLPGHAGSVNEVVFHPQEPIIASASSDRNIYLGEMSDV